MRVCQNNDVKESQLSLRNSYKSGQAWNRISQIFTLEFVLQEHRNKFGSVYEPLAYEKALHHMVFQITHWRLADIKALSLNEMLFVISEKLCSENLPPAAKAFLQSVNLPCDIVYPLDEFSEADWAPKENSVFLKSHS